MKIVLSDRRGWVWETALVFVSPVLAVWGVAVACVLMGHHRAWLLTFIFAGIFEAWWLFCFMRRHVEFVEPGDDNGRPGA